jgi:outer membrane biosynthesis protein TonB
MRNWIMPSDGIAARWSHSFWVARRWIVPATLAALLTIAGVPVAAQDQATPTAAVEGPQTLESAPKQEKGKEEKEKEDEGQEEKAPKDKATKETKKKKKRKKEEVKFVWVPHPAIHVGK